MSAPDSPRMLVDHGGAEAWHASWQQLAEVARARGGCDALVVDAPYSERTHAGHDGGAEDANGPIERPDVRGNEERQRLGLRAVRRPLDYPAWHADDVHRFVETWHPLVRGWIVSLTDDLLFPAWRAALAGVGRQTFQDIPAIVRGMTVRLVGDGPSSWAIHCAVARPRNAEMAAWGTLDGGYVGPYERQLCVGGKPLWLMRALIRDYTRPGDLVCDPCCGAGTTLLAARLEGRRAIGGDILAEHAELAAERLRELPTRDKRGTLALFGGDR